MKHLSILSFVSAALCILWACDPVEIDDPDNGKDNGGGGNNKNDSTQVKTDSVDWSDPDWYEVNFWERTDRQKAGLRGPVKKWHIGTYTTYREYEYDRAGHLIKEYYIDTEDPEENDETRYTYDAQGHRIKEEYYPSYSKDEPAEYWTYEYENTGKFVAREWFMMGPKVSDAVDGIWKDLSKASCVIVQPLTTYYRDYTYTFRNDSLVIWEHTYDLDYGAEDPRNDDTLEYVYAYKDGYPVSLSSNRLRIQVENITYYPNRMYKDFEYLEESAYNFETGWDRYSYRMLDNPRYLEVDTFSLGGMYSYMSLTPQTMKKTYDSHFDIVKNEEWYTTNTDTVPSYTDTWTDYTYDKYGNWVTREEAVVGRYDGNCYPSTITRVMEYFE